MQLRRMVVGAMTMMGSARCILAQDPVMIQGFHWDANPGGVWYDTLRSKVTMLSEAGITAIWYPPVYKGQGGLDVGYTPYDWYDLGEYDSRGGNISSGTGADIPTRYGTHQKLIASINGFKAKGMQVYADIVMNHRQGGLLETIGGNGGTCPPPGGGAQAYTAFPLTFGSGRMARGANGGGNQWYYPNGPVNAGNTFDYCGPQFNYFNFYTNSFGVDVAQHDGNGTKLAMGDSLIAWGTWLTNRLGLDGYRIDNCKGIHPAYLSTWGNSGAMNGKFMVGEIYDGNYIYLQDWLSRMGGRPNTSVFDFSLRFSGLKPLCDNSSFDIRGLHDVGLVNRGTPSTQVVTFVDNHDFDRTDWQGNHCSGCGHDPIVNDKRLAYAYILMHEGYPCIWWHDYFRYGIRNDINTLLAARRYARGGQDIPTKYSGADTPTGSDLSKTYVVRRYGVGSSDTSGVLLVINSGQTLNNIWVTAFGWGGKWLKDITGNYPLSDSTRIFPASGGQGPRVFLKAPARGYAIWVPTSFPSPLKINMVASRAIVPTTAVTSQITPKAVFYNRSTQTQSGVLTTFAIQPGNYSHSRTIASILPGDSATLAYPVFTVSDNTAYIATASVQAIAGSPTADDTTVASFRAALPAFTIDGNLSEAQYDTLATKRNGNSGFGSNINMTRIVCYTDPVKGLLYLGVAGRLNTGSSDGFGMWIDVLGRSGAPAGTSLGINDGVLNYINGGGNVGFQNYKADFEVDYEFSFNPGGGATTVYCDAAKWNGSNGVLAYQGSCSQSGGVGDNSGDNGAVFNPGGLVFAFNNTGGATTGLEMCIPFSELGVPAAESIRAFAFVVSNTAFFSDVTLPGNVTGPLDPQANLAWNPNFGSLPGGPYHSGFSNSGVLRANAKVLLQGPYNTVTSLMNKTLNTGGVLAAHFGAITIPANAVDSINVEIRDAITAAGSTIRKFQPAWLLQNGSMVDFADSTKAYLQFAGAPTGAYYIVIRHRNHLAIMTATPQALTSSTPLAYDFTTSQSQAYGSSPMVLVNPGVYAMYAGDVNQSTLVSSADANLVFGVLNATGYDLNDANLSGVVSASDANLVFGNLNAISNVSRPAAPPMPLGRDGKHSDLKKLLLLN